MSALLIKESVVIKALGNLTKAVVQVAVVPVDIVADFATLGGAITDKPEPYTVKRLKQAYSSVEKACDSED